jgi:microcystin-dependent protein
VPDENWLKNNKRLICDGSAISRTKYPRLFSALGVTYGVGDGTTTFNLPNYIGKMLFGSKTTVTETGGKKNVTLTENELPEHSHNMVHRHTAQSESTQIAAYSGNSSATPSLNDNTKGKQIVFGVKNIYIAPNDADVYTYGESPYRKWVGKTGAGNPFSIMNPYNTAVPVITY